MWLRLFIAVIIVYLLYRLISRPRPNKESLQRDLPSQQVEELVEDPVCHAYVPISLACCTSIDGKTLYFCGPSCLEQYRKVNQDNERRTS
jgi:YHS domain-containing protein